MTDPIADMLTRIRNAYMRGHESVMVPASRMKAGVLDVLVREGYLHGYEKEENEKKFLFLKVFLKYYNDKPVIVELKRISKPGCRVYSKIKDLPKVRNGLGISILSTPKGILSDAEAMSENVGGEVLCTVF